MGLRVGIWVASFTVTGALLWWLFDLTNVLRFSAYLSAGRIAEAQVYTPHPIIQINASWLFALTIGGTIAIGVDMLWHPPRYADAILMRNVADEARAAALRRVPIWGGILVGVGVLALLVFGYLWAVAR